MDIWELVAWLFLAAVLGIAETLSVSMVAIWFSFGALAALIVGLLGAQFWLQCVVFIVVSAVLLAFTRPLARKYVNSKRESTNSDRNIGQVCVVTSAIDNIAETGEVKVLGKFWKARSESGEAIPEGQTARVLRIEGVTLWVNPEREDENT
jgi:membrane protein implicated in regulation of membrane protease activity